MTLPADTRELHGFASEIKFLVDPVTGARIRDWARARMEPDPYGTGAFGDQYRTSSLYFDTPEFDVFHRRGSYGRSKLRIRRYDGETTVFLERKLRRGTRLQKRRTVVPLSDLAQLDRDIDTAWAGAWFARRLALRRLHAVCQITYDRTARIATGDYGRIRLTLDEGVAAIARETRVFANEAGQIVAPDGIVLELKYHTTIPSVFKQLIEEFTLASAPVSKYRLAAEALGLAAVPVAVSKGGPGSASYA